MDGLAKHLKEPRRPDVSSNNTWYEDRDTDHVIVFVHGVLSNSRDCWYHPRPNDQPGVYWPDLLVQDPEFAKYSIYLGGYYTDFSAEEFGVADCADHLFEDLKQAQSPHRSVLEHSAIVFVCHSTGGIVVRYMLDAETEQFTDKSIGLVLIASPSYGSYWASALPVRILANLDRHAVAKELRWASPILRDLDGRFKKLVSQERIPRLLGKEACENWFVFKRKYLPRMPLIVAKESAGRYFGPTEILPETDHFTSVKPHSRDHPAYKLLSRFRCDFETSFSLIPLEDFDAIYKETLKLLTWIGDEPKSEFIMTAATPVFGIERDRETWNNALKRRLQATTKGLKTEFFCLDPLSFNSESEEEGLDDSPLWKFCTDLKKGHVLDTSEAHTAADLYFRSIEAFFSFADLAAESEGIEVRCGPQPPFHFAMARNGDGKYKGILYFTGIQSPEGLVVKGFLTEEHRWIRLMNLLYEFLKKDRPDVLEVLKKDTRSVQQKSRCFELLKHQLKHREEYSEKVGGYEVVIHPDVFPPEMGRLTVELLEAVAKVGQAIHDIRGERPVIGIDVGTGTGILSLALAKYCDTVHATDISKIAVQNALENAWNHNAVNILVRPGNLFERVPDIPPAALTVAIFNYPFYVSPLAVFNPKGKNTAGIEIVRKFFDQINKRLTDDSIVILPYSHLADADPKEVAAKNGFKGLELKKDSSNDLIYAFTRRENIAAALLKAGWLFSGEKRASTTRQDLR